MGRAARKIKRQAKPPVFRNADAPTVAKRKQHVFVAVLTDTGDLSARMTQFLRMLDRVSLDPAAPWRFSSDPVANKRPVHYARNVACKMFLATDADALWFIDHDMNPGPHSWAMLNVDADIVTGLAHALHFSEDQQYLDLRPCIYKATDERATKGFHSLYTPTKPLPPFEVDAAGTGCLLIRRQVFMDPRMLLPTKYVGNDDAMHDYMDEQQSPDWAPPFFRTKEKPDGSNLRSEDIDFCWRAKQLGYRLMALTASRFGHFKTVDLDVIVNSLNKAFTEGIARGRKEKPREVQHRCAR